MAFSSSTLFSCSSPSFAFRAKSHKPIFAHTVGFSKSLVVRASTTLDHTNLNVDNKSSTPLKTHNWKWKFNENLVNIYYEEHEGNSSDTPKNILMVPTISNVSTVEEWRSVAREIVQRNGTVNWRATIVDWPGFGYSDRPKIDYNADVMEKFIVDFINSSDSPINGSDDDLVVFGGGHAATITVRAVKRDS